MEGLAWLAVAVAAFGGSFVQTVSGFGAAIVAMAVMTLVLPLTIAAPVQTLLGLFLSLLILGRHWDALDRRETLLLLAASLPAIPLGVYLLTTAPRALITGALGVLLVLYALWSLRPRAVPLVYRPNWAWAIGRTAAGFGAGLLGGAFATNGPTLMVYGTLRAWPKETFRAVLQSCFVVNTIVIEALHVSSGLLTWRVVGYVALGLPLVALGVWAGRLVDPYLDPERFRRVVLYLVLAMGVVLTGRAVL